MFFIDNSLCEHFERNTQTLFDHPRQLLHDQNSFFLLSSAFVLVYMKCILTCWEGELVNQELQVELRKQVLHSSDYKFLLSGEARVGNVSQALHENILHNRLLVVCLYCAVTLRALHLRVAPFEAFYITENAQLAECVSTLHECVCKTVKPLAQRTTQQISQRLYLSSFLHSLTSYHCLRKYFCTHWHMLLSLSN